MSHPTIFYHFKSYLASLFDQELIPTALKTAIAVGTVLFLINHGFAVFRGEMTRERWFAVLLTYCMPYLVNVHGQYSYRYKLRSRR